jgi:hypothetical protein
VHQGGDIVIRLRRRLAQIRERDQLLSQSDHGLEPEAGEAADQNQALEWWRHDPVYSPLPDLDDVQARSVQIFSPQTPGAEIDLQVEDQLLLIDELGNFYADQPFSGTNAAGMRYRLDNDWFGGADALVLYGMLRHLRPARVIEIGSGYSSAVMLDTRERFLDGSTRLTFVDPEPERLMSLLSPADLATVTVLPERLQKVDPAIFKELSAGDILFVDSSHVSKVGSDVNFIFFQILPQLPPGVFVHFHDIFYPFEYPEAWVLEGRAWNEAYMVRSFLAFNNAFRIRLFNSYLQIFHLAEVGQKMPLWAEHGGACSLWLQRA